MSVDGEMRPPDDSWVVALHGAEHDVHPSGSGVVIGRRRILTCAHVAHGIQNSAREIWVAFPKSKRGPAPRLRVERAVFAESGATVADLAVLYSLPLCRLALLLLHSGIRHQSPYFPGTGGRLVFPREIL